MNIPFRIVAMWMAVMCIAACDNDRREASAPGAPPPAPEPAMEIVLSGIAATGAALDGAVLEIVDASGNAVDIGDVLTGDDGAYQVNLPSGTNLPVIVRVTPPGGTPLVTIVPPSADDTTDVIANINPVTNLVSGAALQGADVTDNAALAGALAAVDIAMIDSEGD
ncbi:MAG: hypothetical protein KDI19_15980, partial [Pseudomonadales bacterium]|nr:hypothetical protein [Pseudomonadales bacterium]